MKFHLFRLLIMKSVTQIVYYIKKLSAAINKLKALMIIINSYTKLFLNLRDFNFRKPCFACFIANKLHNYQLIGFID